eukprot:4986740-Alexandrium_andersonii.AAC.1
MSASLVGSEMCIRDSLVATRFVALRNPCPPPYRKARSRPPARVVLAERGTGGIWGSRQE